MDLSRFCCHCKQLNSYCRKLVYKDFITKKLFYLYSNKVNQPIFKEIKEQTVITYNMKRIVNYADSFRFYDGAEIELVMPYTCIVQP